jgi:hypothetical protein
MAVRYINKVVTIEAGESLSAIVDCSMGAPIAIHMPEEWTPATISFRVSPDSTNFGDLFDSNANEIAYNILAGTSLLLKSEWGPIMYLRIRSGGRDAPVAQELTRRITVTIDSDAAISS